MGVDNRAEKLVGIDLTGFWVGEMTEVYRTDEDGRKVESLGFLHNEDVAKAFAEALNDSNYTKIGKAFVLTNGKEGFLVGQPVILLNEREIEANVRIMIMGKLSPAQRKLLGLKE
ncbi:MAG: hypothetical protein Q7S32_01915 [bacterium]|nr:hypothetical protein [bacterium]